MYQIKPWQELTFTDDYMFKKAMEARRICKGTLNRILPWNVQRIRSFETEKPLQALYASKGVRLDAYIHDERERIYDIEMQVRKMYEEKDVDTMMTLAKRARFNLAEIDIERMQRGSLYSDLHPTMVIFLCPFPIFDGSRSIYRFPRICIDDPALVLQDESELLFVTSKGNRDGLSKETCAFLDYLGGKVSDDPFVQRIEERIHRVKKKEQEERDYMIFEMKLREERAIAARKAAKKAAKKAHAEGKAEGEGHTVFNMLLDHAPMQMIEKYSGWTADQIAAFAKKNHLALS